MEVEHDPCQQTNDHCNHCPCYIQIREGVETRENDKRLCKHKRRVISPGYQVKGAKGWIRHALLDPTKAEVDF